MSFASSVLRCLHDCDSEFKGGEAQCRRLGHEQQVRFVDDLAL